ncbi:MAG: helicase-associated domain-containing protein [Halobacteriota archaeon]|nr:helicase-associated domain-containing protein [Halobacteriota archaeon]
MQENVVVVEITIDEGLRDLNESNLERIASLWDLESAEVLKEGNFAGLSERMKDSDSLRRVLDKLTPRDLQILGIFARKGWVMECNDLYDYGIYEEELGNLPTYNWQKPRGLAGSALILKTKKFDTHGPTVFMVPIELRETIIAVFSESSRDMEFKDPVKQSKSGGSLLNDLFIYLSFISGERPALTKNLHQIPKRSLEKLNISNGRISFIQEICEDLNLTKKGYNSVEDEYIIRTTSKAEDYIATKEEDKIKEIFSFLIMKSDANDVIIVNGLKKLEVGTWYDLDLFFKNLKSELFVDDKIDRWRRFSKPKIKQFLERLRMLDMVAIGHNGDKTAFSLTPIGAHVLGIKEIEGRAIENKFIVQPNFEVTVFPETKQRTLFYLSKFSEVKSHDQVVVYLLTKVSVLGALDNGLKIEEIIDFLNENSQNDMPQNVIYSLRSWGSNYGGVKLMRGTFFEADKGLSDLIKKRIEPHVIKEVTPSLTIIEGEEAVNDLMKIHDEIFLEIDDPIQAKVVEKVIEEYIVNKPSPTFIVIKKESLKSVIQALKKSEIYPKNLIN